MALTSEEARQLQSRRLWPGDFVVVTMPPDQPLPPLSSRRDWHGIVVKPFWSTEKGLIDVVETADRKIPSRVRLRDVRKITKEEYDTRERAYQEHLASIQRSFDDMAKRIGRRTDRQAARDRPLTVGDVNSLIWWIIFYAAVCSLLGISFF
jgi:hypothetical protein